MKNPVVHFEMPYKDKNRVADFYKKAFDWEMQMMGEEMGNYVVAQTAEKGEGDRPKNGGEINGGFFPLTSDNNIPSVVISVVNIDEAMKSIEAAGGKILKVPQDIPGIGMWAVFEDSEGNRVSILQPSMLMEQPQK